MAGVRIIEEPARTGPALPTDAELSILLDIVAKHHPRLVRLKDDEYDELGIDLADFKRAFIATTRFFRIPGTDRSRFFYTWVERASELVGREVRSDAFLAACLAACVPVKLASPAHGQLLEIGLNEFQGASANNAAIRQVIATGVLPPPVPPRQPPGAPIDGLPTIKFIRA